MEFTKPFSKLGKGDANIAGGKGASLGEMLKSGIPVPDGFVVLSSTFDHFLHETDLTQEIEAILKTVDHKAIHTIDSASEKIRGLIENQPVPEDIAKEIKTEFSKLGSEFVAVRSSATAEDGAEHAWAGQLESFLNTNEDALLDNVRKCWGSLFTPRAIFYRFEKELHGTDISVAVVVQKMIQSEVSGIAFSVHPITEDYNQLIIEAGYGLGEAIVSGSITPDSYVVEKEPRSILDTNVSEQKRGLFRRGAGNEWKEIESSEWKKQKLSNEQISELSNIILNIENHYAFPCDIEWAFEGGKFYIVQSRPITTLSINPKKSIIELSKIFSRERSFLYFSMWNDSDRMGLSDFIGHNVQNNLFLRDGSHNKGTVWYDQDELTKINSEIENKLNTDSALFERLMDRLNTDWDFIYPYVSDKKVIKDTKEFEYYYNKIVHWWSAMAIMFVIPDLNISEDYKKRALDHRREVEKYSTKMNELCLEFWNINYPEYRDVAYVILPEEVLNIENKMTSEIIGNIRGRLDGFGLLNNQVYLKDELQKALDDSGLILKEEKIQEGLKEIKGNVAYKGKVRGRVKILLYSEQLDTFKDGEILVAEMTEPSFVPAIKRAAAIITDEGGITCHAAIAAREFKIPCITGTRVATQILKDGAEVEVDADNGVVRILGQNNLNPDEYIRMFAGKSLQYLLTDVFLGHYNPMGVLSVQGESSWMCFLPKSTKEKTLVYGKELYTSKEKYKEYKEGFDEYMDSSSKYFESVISKNNLTSEDIKEFFRLASKHFYFYSKTEFFYTDLLTPEIMAISVQEFDKLKLDGRSYLNKVLFEENGYIRRLVKRIFEEKGITEKSLMNYSIQDLIELIESGKKVGEDVVKERDIFFVSENTNLAGKEAKTLIHRFFAPYQEISDTIRGTIANKGKVRGKARIMIPDFSNFEATKRMVEEMQEGEILVAETTAPEIIQACHKAVAIVTNQGGMLSHAAIISRELNIPCIIGTDKEVTLNIKTGDEIEVDADNGIIRILK